MKLVCKVCGKIFETRGNARITCSRECANTLEPKRPRVEVLCKVCGKKWFTTKSWRKTCSKECAAKNSKKIVNGMFKCGHCHQYKPTTEFYYYKGHPKGVCKECDNESMTRHKNARKREFIELKGGKCQKCGYNRCKGALDFHHTDPTKKEFPMNQGLSKEKMLAELEKCIILCATCHREEHTLPENW